MAARDEDFAFELDDALLESIAGGKLTGDQELTIYKLIQLYRHRGRTKADLMKVFSRADDQQVGADATSFIEEVWDSVTV